MIDDIILVDKDDNVVGYGEKLEVHQKELLHRAFSIFIYDRKENVMLLQKRAKCKYHSGGLWTNACCSHPRRGETMTESIQKRLLDELGLDIAIHIYEPDNIDDLKDTHQHAYKCGKFRYFAKFDTLSEHEMDHVFLLCVSRESIQKEMLVNPEEIEAVQWMVIPELREWFKKAPDDFTAWFGRAFEIVDQWL